LFSICFRRVFQQSSRGGHSFNKTR